MSRIDHYGPQAPAATSVVPSANVAIRDQAGRLLLIHRGDNGNWALPGGGMELGESLPQAARREVAEEVGLQVEVIGLVGIYTDPWHVIEDTDSGQLRQECSVVFAARVVGGQPTPSSEASQVRWVSSVQAASLPIDRSMRIRIGHSFADGPVQPHLG